MRECIVSPVHLEQNFVWKNSINFNNIYDTEPPVILKDYLQILAEGGDELTDFSEVNLSTDKDSYCWTLVLNTYSGNTYNKCKVSSFIKVSFEDFPESTFIVDDRRMTRTANNDGTISMSYSITARSKTALLGDWSTNISSTWENISAYDIIKEISEELGVEIDFTEMPNWVIPLVEADGLLPIEIIKKLTDACGCFLTTIGDKLYIKQKYSTAPVLWNDPETPFKRDISSLTTCTNIVDYISIGDNYTEVIVSDYQDSSSFNIRLELEELISETEGIFKLISAPVLSPGTAQEITKTSHLPDGVFVSYLGEFLEEITETIEIINGKGSTNKQPYSINVYDYGRNTNLGELTISSDNAITSEIQETSLVNITYLTHAHKFKVTSNDTKVQVYTEI